MQTYSKRVLSIQEQIQAFIDAGLQVPYPHVAEGALRSIGYYRLRGYSYQWYDNATKRYKAGVSFSDILYLYLFDTELSHTIFSFLSKIEVALRARLTDALLQSEKDALILMNPSQFKDKKLFWQNLSSIASEITRSNDVFIQHHYDKHDGVMPIWATVEVLSFGTLSKLIKNLRTGPDSAFAILAESYKYVTSKGRLAKPSKECFTSWIHICSICRNICAHNGRLYNRVINIAPEILAIDKTASMPKYSGVYEILLAMKYLSPNAAMWNRFIGELKWTFSQYDGIFNFQSLNFPSDWEEHLKEIHINGWKYDNSKELRRLMHDLSCENADEMYSPILAERTRYFKETEEGQNIMRSVWKEAQDETVQEERETTARIMLEDGESEDKVARYSRLSLEEVRAIAQDLGLAQDI